MSPTAAAPSPALGRAKAELLIEAKSAHDDFMTHASECFDLCLEGRRCRKAEYLAAEADAAGERVIWLTAGVGGGR